MPLYAAIDLHSNNSVLCVLDESDRIVFSKRLPNNLSAIAQALQDCPGQVQGVAVESTYNGYWLVDGLMDASFTVHLVHTLESAILTEARPRADYQALNTVPGIGKALALTIALESGDMSRFASAGNFASYARTVDSRRESNGKKKGSGNTKCGNKHLAWAFIEAAHFAVRYDETIRRWFQRKCAKTLQVVAIKAVAHKLARACYHVMKSGQPFDAARAFG